jgi:hypothetical protein
MPTAASCPRCGLLVARWQGFALDVPTHPALDQPWEELLRAWDDDTAHARFLEAAASADALDVAAARYRLRRVATPADGRAQKGLEKAANLAQRLYQMRARSERPPKAPIILRIVGTMFAGLILLAALWVLWTALSQRR